MKKLIYLLTLAVLVIGCASYQDNSKRLGMSEVRRSFYDFDLSDGSNTGELKILCRPPSIQYMIKNYIVEIDGYDALTVSKHSDTAVVLNAGSHFVKLHPVGPFGIASKRKFNLEAGQSITLEYTGPFSMFSMGKIVIMSRGEQ